MDQKTVVLGITGCIAAYKSCYVVRGLQKAGFRVKVVMTEHATHFIDPVTFRALTHEKVAIDLFDDPADPIHHISLAQEADVFVIAPCTANMAAKIAHGIAD
ncbi:MAG: flavoprotein, partial [Coriobacteriia bacterium]|nr:flavoprotein [Coriobacteriia bacterium]